jgi:signal transduction histidine kinase/DNA-binding response OmpR family regulator
LSGTKPRPADLRAIPSRWPWHRMVIGAMGPVALVIIVLQIYLNVVSYRRHFAEGEALVETMARVVEDQTQRSLQSVFLVLDAVQADGAGLRDALDHDAVKSRIRSVPEIRGLYLVEPDGQVIDSTLSADDIGVSVRDHDYIRSLQKTDGPMYVLGKPVTRRNLAGPDQPALAFMPLAVRLPDQSGYLVAAVNISFLELQYQPMLRSNGVAVSLISFDGTVLMDSARVWHPGLVVAKEDPIFNSYLPHTESATFNRAPANGRASELVSFRVTRSFPVVVVTTLAVEALQNGWRRSILPTLLPTIVSVGLVLMAFGILARQFRQIAHQERELRASRDAAEAASNAKSRFLAVMSHEIRTPMNAVLGLSSALLEHKLQPEHRRSVQAIHTAGDGLLVILNDILDYSRLQAGEMSMEAAPVAPASIVDDAVKVIQPLADGKGLALSVALQPDLPAAVLGDAGRLRQVLLNVLSNAVKFTKQGGITITLSSHPASAGNTLLEWCITDTGIGIDPDRIGSIFREFVQADNTIHRQFGGSGLGLAICKQIIEQMGGSIEMAPGPERGTTVRFRVELPVAHLPADAKATSECNFQALQALLSARKDRLRVLIVDDNQTNHLVVKKLLGDLAIDMDSAYDGAEAVVAAARAPYDVILMDVRMPNMDGLTATRAIREGTGPNARSQILAVTASALPEDVDACLAAGMNACLTKPVRKQTLVQYLSDTAKPENTPCRSLAGKPLQAETTAVILDHQIYSTLKAEVGADEFPEIVSLFLEEAQDRLMRLHMLSPETAQEMVSREAHSLKGSAATLGLMRLAAEATLLEEAVKSGTVENYRASISRLDDAFRLGERELSDASALAA